MSLHLRQFLGGRRRCRARIPASLIEPFEFGSSESFSAPCRKLVVPGRKLCRHHLRLRRKRQRVRVDPEKKYRRRFQLRAEKWLRARAHEILRQRQRAARSVVRIP